MQSIIGAGENFYSHSTNEVRISFGIAIRNYIGYSFEHMFKNFFCLLRKKSGDILILNA